MKNYRIGIIDDNHKIANQLLKKMELLEEVTVLFYQDRGAKALTWLESHSEKPDIILMDIEMPDMDGIETTFRIKEKFPEIKIIMLTVFEAEENIFNAIKAGATGYLLKEERLNQILKSFEEVMDGGAPMSAQIAQKTLHMLMSGYKPDNKLLLNSNKNNQLSKRESEILDWLTKGLKNGEVAEKLFISEATVKKHIENIYEKLQVHSRVELVNWYNKLSLFVGYLLLFY
jgi:DNA-binding NarL/FixJ family response regulator